MNNLKKLYWFFSSQFGINPRRFILFLRGLPSFLRDWRLFRKNYIGRLSLLPCLHDRFEDGGATKSEYFWQDLLVARLIFETAPAKHVDVGSRVDGFVAHVASFREIEVFDVRPISTEIPRVIFRQADLIQGIETKFLQDGGYCDSLSCLHALEHFGLGRYGDPINTKGHQMGITNMAKLLHPGGSFYLSTPIGRERVEFNANWVFDPRGIVRCAGENGLVLHELIIVTTGKSPQKSAIDEDTLAELATQRYKLGLFIFIKRDL